MTSGVYSITNTQNGKRYIGVSWNALARLSIHRRDLKRGKHHNKALQADWSVNGAEAFKFDTVELCNQEELEQKEQDYIALFRTNEPEYGYNCSRYSPYSPAFKTWSGKDPNEPWGG